MSIQAVALILGQDHDAHESCVDEIGESKIDQTVLAAKGNRWFGPFLGQWQETFSFTSSEN